VSDSIAIAASSVIFPPRSRWLTVLRVTPRREASPACVRPSFSRRALYSVSVMLGDKLDRKSMRRY
jgi:hypothetical protein